MQDLDEFTVTDAVLEQMASTADPRLREIMAAAVRHLHAFAREVNLTPAEWLEGIKFLTAVGHASTPIRQEFILLSDVLGLSALVNALHDKTATEAATQTSLLGPFFRDGAPELPAGAQIVQEPGAQEIVVHGRVVDTEGRGIPDAIVQVWQTDAQGLYDLQANDPDTMDARGNFRTDAQGKFHFRTVRPLGYSIPMDGPVGKFVHSQARHGMRPSHTHFLVGAPGFRELVTALYFGDDENIASDTVFGVSKSLVVSIDPNDPACPISGLPSVRYDFQLSHAAADGEGRVGADPASIVAAH
jgi:protocatechuate 3,4-dioxygenase beta subunit